MREQDILQKVYAAGYRIESVQLGASPADEWRILVEAKHDKRLRGRGQDADIVIALLKALAETMMLELADLRLAQKRRALKGNQHKPSCNAEEVTTGGDDHAAA